MWVTPDFFLSPVPTQEPSVMHFSLGEDFSHFTQLRPKWGACTAIRSDVLSAQLWRAQADGTFDFFGLFIFFCFSSFSPFFNYYCLPSTTDVLRRSSVRSRTEIFQGTPEKDGDKSKVSPKKVTKVMSQNGGHGTTDKKLVTEDELTSCGSVSLTSGHAHELWCAPCTYRISGYVWR
jgi:hypothetical protein